MWWYIFLILITASNESFNVNLFNDFMLYKRATLTEHFTEKLKKYKLALRFLITSLDKGVYPKFRRWKNLKTRRIKNKSFHVEFY